MSFYLDIFRYDSQVADLPHRDRIDCAIPTNMTVPDASHNVKAEKDGAVSFRRSCRAAICGSCSMNINGTTGLACKTNCKDVIKEDGSIQVDPMPNFQPMKDL